MQGTDYHQLAYAYMVYVECTTIRARADNKCINFT